MRISSSGDGGGNSGEAIQFSSSSMRHLSKAADGAAAFEQAALAFFFFSFSDCSPPIVLPHSSAGIYSSSAP